MARFSPQWLIAPAAVIMIAAVWLFRPEVGVVGRDVAAQIDPVADATRRELQSELDAVSVRIAYKEELIGRLVVGDATLDEVAGEFLAMNRGTPALDAVRFHYPGSDDREKSARNVLDYVNWRSLPAWQKARVFQRLHREFEQTYGPARAVSE